MGGVAIDGASEKGPLTAVRAFGENVLDPILGVTRRVCQVSVWIGGLLMIGASILIGVEVLIRKFFSLSIGGADEIGGYVLSMSAAWAFGFALLQRGHVRIDSIYVTFPPRVRAGLDLLGVALFMYFFGLILYYAYDVLADSIRVGTVSWTKLQTPLVIPQSVWFAGLLVSVFVAFLLFLRSLIHFAAGDLAAMQPLVGSRSVDEELKEEIKGLEEVRTDLKRDDGE